MSTQWGLFCISHDPPLGTPYMLNHGFDSIVEAVPQVRAGTWPMVEDPVLGDEPVPVIGSTGAVSPEPIAFLLSHPRCRLALVCEYGETWFLDDGPVQVSGPDKRMWRHPVRDEQGRATGEWESGVYPPEGEVPCTCISTVPAVTYSEFLRPDGWVRCITCGGLVLLADLSTEH